MGKQYTENKLFLTSLEDTREIIPILTNSDIIYIKSRNSTVKRQLLKVDINAWRYIIEDIPTNLYLEPYDLLDYSKTFDVILNLFHLEPVTELTLYERNYYND